MHFAGAMAGITTPRVKPPVVDGGSGGHFKRKESFDDLGDLQLIVGAKGSPDQTIFTVCSRALSRGSPVFNRMLHGPWTEKQPLDGGAWTVELPEDHPASMRFLLSILHGHFRKVDVSLSLVQIHQICVCADKYDITEPLGPWAVAWCQAAQANGRQTTEDRARTAWIAWVLGNKDLLEESTKELTWKSKPASLMSKTAAHLVPLDSTGILDRIKGIQRAKAWTFVETFQGIWRRHLHVKELSELCAEPVPGMKAAEDRKKCGAAILGSLTASLSSAGLLPSSKPVRYEDLILHDLGETAKRISTEIVTGNNSSGYGSVPHRKCGPSLQILGTAEVFMHDTAIILTEANHEHVRKQASKIGVVYPPQVGA